MKFCLSVVSLSIEKIEMSMFLSDYIFTSHNQLQQKSLRGYFYESRDGITSGEDSRQDQTTTVIAQNHSTKIYDLLPFILSLCTTIRPKIKVLIDFLFSVHDHSTKVRGHFYYLIYSFLNCGNISFAKFMEVLPLYFARCTFGSTAFMFRPLYSQQYYPYISNTIFMEVLLLYFMRYIHGYMKTQSHSWDIIFHINTFSRDEKRSALPNFSLYACLFKILKKQPIRAAGKKILLKFKNMFKYMYMISQQQTRKFTKHELFHYGVLEPC